MMDENQFDAIIDLLKIEIQDAKIKAFDSILTYILQEDSTEDVIKGLDRHVYNTYLEYKNDIQLILKIYFKDLFKKNTSPQSMSDFLKDNFDF